VEKRLSDHPTPSEPQGSEAFALEAHPSDQRVRAALSLLESGGVEELADGPSDLKGIPACEAFLERSWKLRNEDPDEMVRLAMFANLIAGKLEPEVHGLHRVKDLQCRAWAALGNAYRVADDLDAADLALGRAAELYLEGSRDELLGAHLFDLQASLFAARRSFAAALQTLDVVHEIYVRHGDQHRAGRALIAKGSFSGIANDPEGAIRLLQRGLAMIDAGREPRLTLTAVHNTAFFLVTCGRFREARSLLWQNLPLYEEHGGQLDRIKLQGLRGLICAGLGELGRAEEYLVAARRGFEEAGVRYHASIAGLDLAVVWLRQGRRTEARDLVLDCVRVFLELRIHREALAAVLVLQRAFEKGLEADALLDKARDFLRRIEQDPALTFESFFL
jgi:tetratricopeptide (TPR) repeat protein